jgi:hypothetical protein
MNLFNILIPFSVLQIKNRKKEKKPRNKTKTRNTFANPKGRSAFHVQVKLKLNL